MRKLNSDSPGKLLKAARQAFETYGFEDASGDAIRKAADLSNGVWRHFFPGGKGQAAATICLELHADLWDPVLQRLDTSGRVLAPTSMQRATRHVFEWAAADATRTRLYFALQDAVLPLPEGEPLRHRQAADRERIADWVEQSTSGREVNLPSRDLRLILLFGPALSLARHLAVTGCLEQSGKALAFLAAPDWLRGNAKPIEQAPLGLLAP